MKLTKEQAIDYSIELWEFLAETGATSKHDWSGWKKHGNDIECDCFLCEYALSLSYPNPRDCTLCPYYQKLHGKCWWNNRLFNKWDWKARTEEARKKYAKQFLNQLKELKNDIQSSNN